MKEHKKHLYYLNELSDYKVDSHYADVRGWPVKDNDNRVIGKVDNLLVNKNLMKVVYLDVEVDNTIIDSNYDPYSKSPNSEVREFVNKEGENHIIVPIGMVHIHEDKKYVHTQTIDHRTFSETKRFRSGDNVDRDYEVAVLDSYNRDRNSHGIQQNSENSHDHKESPYRADREANNIQNDFTPDAELSEERRKLESERQKLKEERIKLEEERRKLETERNRRENLDHERDTSNDASIFDTDGARRYSSDNDYPTDDSFYDRGEFDGVNYRNS